MKKPTDKERLDWIQKSKLDVFYFERERRPWAIGVDVPARCKGIRQAIDAAMKQERQAKGGRRG